MIVASFMAGILGNFSYDEIAKQYAIRSLPWNDMSMAAMTGSIGLYVKKIDDNQIGLLQRVCVNHLGDVKTLHNALSILIFLSDSFGHNIDLVSPSIGLLTHKDEGLRVHAMIAYTAYNKAEINTKICYYYLHNDTEEVSLQSFSSIACRAEASDRQPLCLWMRSTKCKSFSDHYNKQVFRIYKTYFP